MGLKGPVGYLLAGGGVAAGSKGAEVQETESEFLDGFTHVSGSFSKKELNSTKRTLKITLTSAGFSTGAKKGVIFFHYNFHSSATGENWKYWDTQRTIDLETEIGTPKVWSLLSLPQMLLQATKYYICIKCYETKEVINDVGFNLVK